MPPRVEQLKGLLQRLQPVRAAEATRVSSGCGPLDACLPGGGFARGTLVEWLAEGPGSGAGTLALVAARQACREGGVLVVIDRERMFYPPAAAAWQIALQSTIVVYPANEKDHSWALDQVLRCEHVAAVLAWPRQLDGHTFRRLQLAAETSGCLGLLIRGPAARRQPSWADVRLWVGVEESGVQSPGSRVEDFQSAIGAPTIVGHPQSAIRKSTIRDSRLFRRLRVELLRARGSFGRRVVELEIDDRTGEIHAPRVGDLAAPVAHPAMDPRQARA